MSGTGAVRVHGSILARAEKKALSACARVMPSRLSPDFFTALGVFGGLVSFLGYWLSTQSVDWLWLSSLGLAIHWFGDSMDGTVARFRGIERPRFGFFLDQGIDVLVNILICTGIGLSPYARMDTALFALTGYHILGLYSAIRTAITRDFHVSLAGFGPTELRLIIVIMNTLIFTYGADWNLFGFSGFSWCDELLIFGFVVMLIIYLVSFITYARELARLDSRD